MAEKSDHDLIIEIHTILTDKDMGVCVQTKRNTEAIFGNGKMGLQTKMTLALIILAVVCLDSPLAAKIWRVISGL